MTFDEICLLDDDVLFTTNSWEEKGRKFYFEKSVLYQENEHGFAMPYKLSVEDQKDKTWHKA